MLCGILGSQCHRTQHLQSEGAAWPARRGESLAASTPVCGGPREGPPIITSIAGSPISGGEVCYLGTLPTGERCSVGVLKGMSGAANPRSNVLRFRNSGSPRGGEAQGNGSSEIVGGRECRLQGKGAQMDPESRGARGASCREQTS
jgi:hypothetical protein